MSKLATWIKDGDRALIRLNKAIARNNDDPESELSHVEFPLPGVMEVQSILKYRKQQRDKLRGHSLAEHRRRFLLNFDKNIHQACILLNQQKLDGTIADLLQPLENIRAALKDLCVVEASDDAEAVTEPELPRELLRENVDCNPRQVWLMIKLGYTRICLEIQIHILKHIYPDQIDFWAEAEEDLVAMYLNTEEPAEW
ncbi:hypothetical protein PFICI_02293 [Pestalotiopsis fici W106-1]|uniref:Uncharacterized protein n=1 Tax=Pestalotiopsis fici (strain W106-1 / CGMCC3.15140) TaxID=1229662 RepID=W3XDW2_PESFW|nr:uncharacterized protein PFICI_02293 [Pestalotiopsis fici W106-1]ETS84268.1 hypothetical protein PFICI_02293 [Pestalotiopsis fici W106-1]